MEHVRFAMMNSYPAFSGSRAVALLWTALAAGCAVVPPAHDPDAMAEYHYANDPAELTNRKVFEINRSLDVALLKPLAQGYRILPQFVRSGVHNFLANWGEPLVFIHDLLQGEPERAGETLVRFVINTTIGFLGVGDVASVGLNIHSHDEDMGQTLAVWGVEEGPYVMLPLFGPASARDSVGRLTDFFMNPVGWVVSLPTAAGAAKVGVEGVDQRERHLEALDDLERASLDYYASLRTLYRQRRTEEIGNGHRVTGEDLTYEMGRPARPSQ